MALGGQDNYPTNDFENIKSSLKLLKSKQPQKKTETPLEPNVPLSPLRTITEAATPQIPTRDNLLLLEVNIL